MDERVLDKSGSIMLQAKENFTEDDLKVRDSFSDINDSSRCACKYEPGEGWYINIDGKGKFVNVQDILKELGVDISKW